MAKAKKELEEVNEKVDIEVTDEVVESAEEKKVAKAGKHSAKAAKEAEEKEAKKERKASSKSDAAKPKVAQKPPKSRLERAGKKYRELAKLIEKDKNYSVAEASDLAIKTSPTKFDATIELHINLDADPKQADQNIRGTLVLPAGSGKSAKVAVFAEGDDAKKAKDAGADTVGGEDFLAELDKEVMDFDTLVTTPSMMPKLAKYARLLGPKGLMPNPKSGTVTTDIAKAVREAKAGKVEYRVDSAGIIHLGIGKASFGAEKIQSNLDTVMRAVRSAKPASVKGAFIKSAYLTSTMGPAIRLEIQ